MTYQPLHNAITALRDCCDGAKDRDNVGFAAPDVSMGHWLATQDADYTPEMARWAWRATQKYQKQLSRMGIDWTQIEEPPVPEEGDYSCFLLARQQKWERISEERAARQQEERAKPVKLSLVGSRISIAFGYDPAKVAAVKEIPGRKFQATDKTWSIPIREETLEPLLAFCDLADVPLPHAITDAYRALLGSLQESQVASRAEDADLVIEGLGGELKPFQRAGVAYAVDKKRCLIADEMGCGKTIEALATLQALDAYPALIVCPASLKLNWAKEAKTWLPGKSVAIWNGTQQDGADITIINYDILAKHEAKLEALNAQAIILDESHYVKNHKAKRTEHCKALAKNIPVRLCLTGTPLVNRPQELLSQLGVIGRLEDLGGFWNFANRYCDAYKSRFGWDFSGASHLDELNTKLRQTCMVRRLKKDVLKELAPKQRTYLPLEISNKRAYAKAERDLIGWLRTQAQEDQDFLDSIADLSAEEQAQAKAERADDTEQRARKAEQLVRIEALKQLTVEGKMEKAIDWISSTIEQEKLVLFCWHKSVVAQLQEKFGCDVITGDTPLDQRQAAVDRFQSDDEARLIILNMRAGGVGLTLTAASHVAFLEFGWTPADHDQAEDRCHRIGQEHQVCAWYLVAPDTIEEKILELIASKRAIAQAAIDGQASEETTTSVLNDLIASLVR